MIRCFFLFQQLQSRTVSSFVGIAYLESSDTLFVIPFEREKVEFVLDVFHTVDVSIQIYIVISHRIDYCIFVMYIAYSRLLFDGTCFVRYVLGDIFELTYIYRCATIQIDNDPNRAGISAGRAVLPSMAKFLDEKCLLYPSIHVCKV